MAPFPLKFFDVLNACAVNDPNGAEGFECKVYLLPFLPRLLPVTFVLSGCFFFNGNILTQENVKYLSKYFIL